MKVSVIVPVYNVEQYLRKCLNSLIDQTLKDIEIIVVNDGSPDNSQAIIDEYQKRYNNIHGYTKPNGGLSDARNFGLEHAKGEYIAFIDSDDYIDTKMLEKMYNKAKEGYDIVVCDSIEVYDNKTIYKKSNFHYSTSDEINYLLSPPMACTRLYKKELFKNNKFQKGIYYEDLNLTPSLILEANKIAFIEEGLYYYVQRSNSIMNQKKYNEKLLDIFKVLKHNKELLEAKYPEEIEYMYIAHLLRTSSLRFMEYENYKELINKVVTTIKEYYPNYKKNKYYKQSSYKLKLICTLAYNKQYKLLKLLKKVGKI